MYIFIKGQLSSGSKNKPTFDLKYTFSNLARKKALILLALIPMMSLIARVSDGFIPIPTARQVNPFLTERQFSEIKKKYTIFSEVLWKERWILN